MQSIDAILLGAGRAKRMGLNKLSLPWKGRTIFECCLTTLLRSNVKKVIVVLNERPREEGGLIHKSRVKVVINPNYKKGMSTSIRRGILAMVSKSDGILIALGDQPFLKARTINALIEAFKREKGKIIVPTFKGKRGHPVIFHRKYKRELLRLRGDMGGKTLLDRCSHDVREVPVRSEGIIKDIDTWEIYMKELKNYYNKKKGQR